MELGHIKPELALEGSFEEVKLTQDQMDFARRVVVGYFAHAKELDDCISTSLKGYTLERIAAVDRNVLRVAAYELFYEEAIPPAVSLNEAIEIAKKYSTAESAKFVNGVLGKVMSLSPKSKWDPDIAPAEFDEEFTEDEELDEAVPSPIVELTEDAPEVLAGKKLRF